MNNIELETKIKEIIAIDNYFDMCMEIKEFQKEYKKSDFYRQTRKPLVKVVKEARLHYALQLKDFVQVLQKSINELDLEHFRGIIDQFSTAVDKEDSDLRSIVEGFKDIMTD